MRSSIRIRLWRESIRNPRRQNAGIGLYLYKPLSGSYNSETASHSRRNAFIYLVLGQALVSRNRLLPYKIRVLVYRNRRSRIMRCGYPIFSIRKHLTSIAGKSQTIDTRKFCKLIKLLVLYLYFTFIIIISKLKFLHPRK